MTKITEKNFREYFFPVGKDYKPKEGQCLACWKATADFIDGWVKRNVIELLVTNKKSGAETAHQIMIKLVSAQQKDASRVLLEMAEDLKTMTIDEVIKKPYRFVIEQFYWTKPEYIPDDPHWSTINVIDARKPVEC